MPGPSSAAYAGNHSRHPSLFSLHFAEPLKELAGQFTGLVRPGGQIVVSGILIDQATALADTYETWFDMSSPVRDGERAVVTGQRRNEA